MLFKNITLIDENYEVKENQYILIEGKEITYIGNEAPLGYEGESYDGTNKIASPGFFNTHCHVPMVLPRGYGEGLDLHRWLHEKMFPFEALLTHEDVYYGAMLGIAEMISSGVVSFSDMYFMHDGICRAVDETGIKANLCHGYTSSRNSPARISEMVRGNEDTTIILDYAKNSGHDRIICDMGIHAEYTSNVPLVEDVVLFATDNNLRIHIHLSETQKEHLECKEHRGMTPAAYFETVGVFTRPTHAAHCVWLEDNDFDILGRNGVSVGHCPSSNLKLGSGIANLKKMYEANINIAIGTDGAASNNNLNMLEEINIASILQKGVNHDPLFISSSDAFALACKNGAKAQGRHNCGSIKVGNRADIIVFSTDSPHMQPVIDPRSNILYSAQSSDIVLSMIDGKVVYKDGEYKTMDIEKIKFNAARIAKEKVSAL